MWYRIDFTWNEVVDQKKIKELLDMTDVYNSLSVSLDTLVVYREQRPIGAPQSIFIRTKNMDYLKTLREKNFLFYPVDRPADRKLEPLRGFILGVDVLKEMNRMGEQRRPLKTTAPGPAAERNATPEKPGPESDGGFETAVI